MTRKLNPLHFIGKKYGKLLIKECFSDKSVKKCICICDCGSQHNVLLSNLINKSTTSCGCGRAKYHSQYANALKVFRGYKKYNDELTFDIFIKYSQLNCHYCGINPQGILDRSLEFMQKSPYPFYFNGIDRVDNNKTHNIYNIVPACKRCNYSKHHHSYSFFINRIFSLYNNINSRSFSSNFDNYFDGARAAWNNGYNDMPFDDFLKMCKMNCYYCGDPPSNKSFAKNKQKYFLYSGLDRIDSSIGHSLENCVPCCHFCNIAKSDQTLEMFDTWIIRCYNHIKKYGINITDVNFFIKKYIKLSEKLSIKFPIVNPYNGESIFT